MTKRSGYCPPWNHPTGHADCQRRQDADEINPCGCVDHGGHTHAETTEETPN